MSHHIHELVLARFIETNPWFSADGFKAAMRELGREVRFLPDAFKVDQEARAVCLVEVEITHPITNAKAYELADLALHLSPLGWSLQVLLVDRSCGQVGVDVPALVEMVEAMRAEGRSPGRPGNTFGVPLEWSALVAAVKCMERGRAGHG